MLPEVHIICKFHLVIAIANITKHTHVSMFIQVFQKLISPRKLEWTLLTSKHHFDSMLVFQMTLNFLQFITLPTLVTILLGYLLFTMCTQMEINTLLDIKHLSTIFTAQ